MTDISTMCDSVLREAGYITERIEGTDKAGLAFEGDTALGFVLCYETCPMLTDRWREDSATTISHYQFGLRKAGTKAWNAYLVLLTEDEADYSKSMLLGAIEEDLGGTRKIVRSGMRDESDIRAALLPLLPLQSPPRLEAVDMRQEVRQRATELPERALAAFLSDADETVVLQVLEEAP